jgi:hypothetical protein
MKEKENYKLIKLLPRNVLPKESWMNRDLTKQLTVKDVVVVEIG